MEFYTNEQETCFVACVAINRIEMLIVFILRQKVGTERSTGIFLVKLFGILSNFREKQFEQGGCFLALFFPFPLRDSNSSSGCEGDE